MWKSRGDVLPTLDHCSVVIFRFYTAVFLSKSTMSFAGGDARKWNQGSTLITQSNHFINLATRIYISTCRYLTRQSRSTRDCISCNNTYTPTVYIPLTYLESALINIFLCYDKSYVATIVVYNCYTNYLVRLLWNSSAYSPFCRSSASETTFVVYTWETIH